MSWRMTNVTLMEPNSLAAQLDNNTDRLFGGHKRKYNPYPRMRMKEEGAQGNTRSRRGVRNESKQCQRAEPLPERSYIQPRFLYALDLWTKDADDVARKVLARCDQARVLFPEIKGEPVLPGYLLLALDHPMTDTEASQIRGALARDPRGDVPKEGCRLLPGPLSEEERVRVLAWTKSEKGASTTPRPRPGTW